MSSGIRAGRPGCAAASSPQPGWEGQGRALAAPWLPLHTSWAKTGAFQCAAPASAARLRWMRSRHPFILLSSVCWGSGDKVSKIPSVQGKGQNLQREKPGKLNPSHTRNTRHWETLQPWAGGSSTIPSAEAAQELSFPRQRFGVQVPFPCLSQRVLPQPLGSH